MAYQALAGAVVALHFAFIVFVLLGAWLVRRDVRWAALHLPAIAWVAYLEITGSICPLTPLENALRERAGSAGYAGSFVEHYLLPVIYPTGLTASIQFLLGLGVVALNALAYAWILGRRKPGGPVSR